MKRLEQLKKVIKKIEQSNKDFKRMTPTQRRVAIAKDALEQIYTRTYDPATGFYVLFKQDVDLNGKEELSECFINGMPKCQVCARGALFISSINKFNNCSLEDLGIDGLSSISDIDAYQFERVENKYFSQSQIALIETMFENDAHFACRSNERTESACIAYSAAFPDPKQRLIEILKNIIRNKGTFIIPKKYYEND